MRVAMPSDEIDDLRLDIITLRKLIDARHTLAGSDDPIIIAASNVLRDREQRLADLDQRAAGK